MAVQLTDSAGVAAAPPPPGPTLSRATARSSRRRRRPVALPYALIAPALVVIALMLGYPLFRLATFSLEEFGLRQQFGAPARFVGFRNFGRILSDSYFWDVLWRTIIFCAVNVALTMLIGLLVALLLRALGRPMRLLVSTGLLLAWAMPALTATVVWQWLFDTQYGFVNWLITRLGGHYEDHAWLTAPLSFFTVATIIVVWMGVPFVAFTLYAGTTQVPSEILEAASIDGAGPWARFHYVMLPVLKPLLLILTALSVLWDFRVFTQIYVLQRAGGINRDTNLLGVYAYRISIGANRFDLGAAIAIVMVIITVLLTVVYLRQMVKQEEL